MKTLTYLNTGVGVGEVEAGADHWSDKCYLRRVLFSCQRIVFWWLGGNRPHVTINSARCLVRAWCWPARDIWGL